MRNDINYSDMMLKGCTSKMCNTDDMSELCEMYESAQAYLNRIYTVNKDRLVIKMKESEGNND